MIRIYTAPSCASCRKVKSWLKEHNISKRSKIIKENDIDIDSMSISELIKFIQENPSVLKRPIMIDERRFQVGYNAEEIRVFIPRELRKLAECPSSEVCPQFISEPCSIKEAYFKDR